MRVLGLFLFLLLAPAAAFAADPTPPAKSVDVAKVGAMMLGTWQDNDNTGFSREFRADGTCVDRSEEDAGIAIAGGWTLFNGTAPPPDMVATMRGLNLPTDGVYLRVFQHDDVYLYAMVSVSPQSLELVDISRKKKMTFLRLK